MVGEFVTHDSRPPVWELESRPDNLSQHGLLAVSGPSIEVRVQGGNGHTRTCELDRLGRK